MKENTNGVATTNSVLIFQQVLLECIGITGFYDIHGNTVQSFNGFVDGSMFLFVVCVVESKQKTNQITHEESCQKAIFNGQRVIIEAHRAPQ